MSAKPVLTADDAMQIARDFYDFKVVRISELVSYDDRNFHMRGYWNRKSGNYKEGDLQDVLLKVSGFATAEKRKLDNHNRIMLHLNKAGINVQVPLKSKTGELLLHVELPITGCKSKKRRHYVRLLKFIQGHTWQSLVPLTEQDYFMLGQQCAQLQIELMKIINHLEAPHSEHEWTLINAPKVLSRVDVIPNEQHRALARDVLSTFEREYVPKLKDTDEKWMNNIKDEQFPIGLIHGDLNDLNILIHPVMDIRGKVLHFGFLDWEDSAITRRCFDLAVLLMSLLCCENLSDRDLPGLGLIVIQGYQEQLRSAGQQLTSEELNALPTMVATRLAQSLISGAYTYHVLSPGNDYTLMTTKQGGWEKLEDIWVKRRLLYQDMWSNATCHDSDL